MSTHPIVPPTPPPARPFGPLWRIGLAVAIIATIALIVALWPFLAALARALTFAAMEWDMWIAGAIFLFIAALLLAVVRAAFAWSWRIDASARQARVVRMQNDLPIDVSNVRAAFNLHAKSTLAGYYAAQLAEAERATPLLTSQNVHVQYAPLAPLAQLTEPAGATTAAELPGAIDLAALGCQPTMDHILLGVDELGQITVAVPDLCHVALLGATGAGKSNLLRLILPQLQKIGASVILADPHFAPIDPENGDDWRPIADRLIQAPAITADAIDQALSFMLDELGRRLELRRENKPVGVPLFFAFDELPVICDLVKDAPARLGKLLREGRKVHLLTVGASQSMLVKEVGGSSTLRDQYRTAFYVGGDRKSAAAMLDIPERDIDDGPLGKGIVLLRSKSTSPARMVRVPLVSNASLYQLFGVSVTPQLAPTEPLSNQPQNGFGFAAMARPRSRIEAGSKPDHESGNTAPESAIPTAETARIVALFKAGKSTADIVRELYGNITGTPYQKRRAEIEAVLRQALEGVR